MKLDFYSNLEKVLLISDYPLYHAYSTITIKDLNQKVLKSLKIDTKTTSSSKDLKSRIENIDVKRSYDNILLSALSTPYYNYYTNYLKIGEELYEHEKEIETETCSRMMGVLKLSVVPSRKNLINYIQENKISENCSDSIAELFDLFENEKNPLKIASRGSKIIEEIKKQNYRQAYMDSISKNLIIKTLANLSNLYENISFNRLKNILNWIDADDLENIILENSRLGLISCSIDHESDMILFNIKKNIQNNLNEKFLNFLNSFEKIGSEIIFNDIKNKKKIQNLRSNIISELNSFNSSSLTLSDNLLASINEKTKQLEDYIRTRDELKNELIEKKIRERNEAKEKAERDAKALKELLKDEQKQKEFDIQLKKFLVERIKVFTNTIILDGKKIRLDDILKDLSKVKDETLIKVLEKEEVEFKTKKEKRFRELARDCDYLLREFRKRDLNKYTEILKQEEIEFNKIKEEEERKNYEEKIKFKSYLNKIRPLKEKYFKEIEKTKEAEYVSKLAEFKANLNEKVKVELLKEVGNHFKTYIEEFRKEEEEARKKANMFSSATGIKKDTNMAFGKGNKFMRFDDKPKMTAPTSMEITSKDINIITLNYYLFKIIKFFNKKLEGDKFTKATDEPKPATTMEIKRGDKFVQPPTTPVAAAESKIIRRGENAQTPQEPPKEAPKQDLGFVRGSRIQEEKKESMVFQRGTKANTTEIKEEKKTAPRESTQTDSITKGNMIMRPKANETPSSNSNIIQRGTNVNQPKKDEKPATTTAASGTFVRGAALQKPAANEEKKVNTDGKDGGWRKK